MALRSIVTLKDLRTYLEGRGVRAKVVESIGQIDVKLTDEDRQKIYVDLKGILHVGIWTHFGKLRWWECRLKKVQIKPMKTPSRRKLWLFTR